MEQFKKPQEKETPQERIKRITGFDVGQCPPCKKGRMYITRKMPRIRSPAGHLPTILLSIKTQIIT